MGREPSWFRQEIDITSTPIQRVDAVPTNFEYRLDETFQIRAGHPGFFLKLLQNNLSGKSKMINSSLPISKTKITTWYLTEKGGILILASGVSIPWFIQLFILIGNIELEYLF